MLGHLCADTHYDIVNVRRQGGSYVPPGPVFGILPCRVGQLSDLRSLAAMADVEEELALVPYAGRPHPIMIRYMIDEAKGNNVNARTLKVWDCSLHR